jgi:hypothetical protein
MLYYLLDASAYVFAVENDHKLLNIDFITQKEEDKAFLYMPQFCVSEVLETFSKKRYSKEEKNNITESQYESYYKTFLDQVHNRKFIYVYDLHRYHNINIGLPADGGYDVCKFGWEFWNKWTKGFTAFQENKRNSNIRYKTPLSTYDILIISMAIELKKIHCKPKITILTNDELLKEVVNNCFYKMDIRAEELKKIS